jgi:AcrR family transcriptional regulator
MTTTDGYHHGDLREACIAAGLGLLADGGPDAVTIRGVARIAGVSHTAPLHHFDDREALLDAIAQRGFDRLLDRLGVAAAAGAMGPRAQLRAYGLAYVEEAVADPGLFALMFGRARDGIGEEAGYRLVELCAEAIDRGELAAPDAQVLSLVLWSTVHGLASLYVSRYLGQGFVTGEPADARAGAEIVLDALFGAFTPARRDEAPRRTTARKESRS